MQHRSSRLRWSRHCWWSCLSSANRPNDQRLQKSPCGKQETEVVYGFLGDFNFPETTCKHLQTWYRFLGQTTNSGVHAMYGHRCMKPNNRISQCVNMWLFVVTSIIGSPLLVRFLLVPPLLTSMFYNSANAKGTTSVPILLINLVFSNFIDSAFPLLTYISREGVLFITRSGFVRHNCRISADQPAFGTPMAPWIP